MLSHEDAVARVAPSPLLDPLWYGALVGRRFGSRHEAATHWVTSRPDSASPHPLFEPAWLYPGGRWRRTAPDPLSFYLSRPAARGRSPHPCFPQHELGDLETWLLGHEPPELLPAPRPRDLSEPAALVDVRGPGLDRAVRWVRHLHRTLPDAVAMPVSVVVRDDAAERRVLEAVAAELPRVLVLGSEERSPDGRPDDRPDAEIVVTVDPEIDPPRWPWLEELLDAVAAPGVAAAQPLLLHDDFTVAAPLLDGHPVQDAERMASLPLPEVVPGVAARRRGASGTVVLAPASRLVGPPHTSSGASWTSSWRAAGFAGPGEPLTVREGRPALRWSIDIPAGAGPIGTRWGDWHFARSLAAALERRGQWVAVDHPETRGRESRRLDDVVLTLRGLERVDPPPHTTNLLWVIYDPDQVSAAEASRHDVVFAAGATWAAERSARWGIPVRPLLQCTDTTRFGPDVTPDDEMPDVLFVGNARGGMRPVVRAAIDAGIEVGVIGALWDDWLPDAGVRLVGDRIANEDLPAAYAGAQVVLCDHSDDMRERGFASNRVFDVLAVGGRLLSDDVVGLDDVLGLSVPRWRGPDDLRRLARAPYDAWPAADVRAETARHVVARHSFDARAETLLEAALEVRARTTPTLRR